MFAEPDLDEVEEISAEDVPLDPARAEADGEVKRAEIQMLKPDGMERGSKTASGRLLVVLLFATQQVDAEGPANAPVKQ